MIKNIFNFDKRSYLVIISMLVITVIALITAKIYYGNKNKALDPRTVHIRELHKKYTLFVEKDNFGDALVSLESIENEYSKIFHYRDSFEIGVIKTNKAALYLTLALYHSPEEIEKKSNLNIAEKLLNTSLTYYETWEKKYTKLSEKDLSDKIELEFKDIVDNRTTIIDKRVKDIYVALKELNRRRSVTYTNLGIIKRHQKLFPEAVKYYKKAIDLWKENYTAKNNLRVLLGKDPQKRGFIEKMFPGDR